MARDSWIAIRRADGAPVLETFSPKVAAAINRRAYAVMTAREWLPLFNRLARQAGGCQPSPAAIAAALPAKSS